MMIFTFGEALYSPKATQYQLAKSPSGKKAIYSGLISVPGFFGSVISGKMSGWLLVEYCPTSIHDIASNENQLEDCGNLWYIVAIVAAGTPFLLWIFSPLFRSPQRDRTLLELESARQKGFGDLQVIKKPPKDRYDEFDNKVSVSVFFDTSESSTAEQINDE
jgi:hypothetical protein